MVGSNRGAQAWYRRELAFGDQVYLVDLQILKTPGVKEVADTILTAWSVVISVSVASAKVHRVFIDEGCSVNVMLKEVFDKMKFFTSRVTSYALPIYGFGVFA